MDADVPRTRTPLGRGRFVHDHLYLEGLGVNTSNRDHELMMMMMNYSLLVRASAVLKSQGPENRSRGRPGP